MASLNDATCSLPVANCAVRSETLHVCNLLGYSKCIISELRQAINYRDELTGLASPMALVVMRRGAHQLSSLRQPLRAF